MTASSERTSATARASGPTVSSEAATGCTPRFETAPYVGRIPDTPQSDAGSRTEPPVSVPIAARQRSAATAAPEPPLEPPGNPVGGGGVDDGAEGLVRGGRAERELVHVRLAEDHRARLPQAERHLGVLRRRPVGEEP